MRSALILVVALAASASAAPPQQSDPAFLGIRFQPAPLGCTIDTTTPAGPAYEVGLRRDDVIERIDGVAMDPQRKCDDVTVAITAHASGDAIEIDVLRGSERIVVHPTLATRSDVLQRRVGRRIEATDLRDVDGVRRWDLSERANRTLVVGAFAPSCSGCTALVDRLAEQLGRRPRTGDATMLAVTVSKDFDADVKQLRGLRGAVPLAVADESTYANLSMGDEDRVFFLVIDCHGIVRLVAPIAPDADDVDAATAEVLAAAEQAEHARTRR